MHITIITNHNETIALRIRLYYYKLEYNNCLKTFIYVFEFYAIFSIIISIIEREKLLLESCCNQSCWVKLLIKLIM